MLTIYAPSDKPDSKCWEVFNGIKNSWPNKIKFTDNSQQYFLNDDTDSMFWGLVNNNTNLIHQIEESGQNWWFTDTPYFGRFNNKNLRDDNHYWRICKNNIHVGYIPNLDNARIKKFNLTIKNLRKKGDYILVCPSSAGIHGFLNELNWLESTINLIKTYTDRPIVIRQKPRGRGTSGPSEATISIQNQLQNAWACVTSCSISAVESLCEGVPVFCHPVSFASAICNTNLQNIENPKYVDPNNFLNSLSYQQFTPAEFKNGTAISLLRDLKVL